MESGISYFYICKFFVYSEKTTTRHYSKQRADEHTMLAFALLLALSLNSSQPSRHRQTICMCVHVHTYRHTYISIHVRVSHFSALPSPPSPVLAGSLLLHKKLIASFDKQLHHILGCFEICMRALGYDCNKAHRGKLASESSQGAPTWRGYRACVPPPSTPAWQVLGSCCACE